MVLNEKEMKCCKTCKDKRSNSNNSPGEIILSNNCFASTSINIFNQEYERQQSINHSKIRDNDEGDEAFDFSDCTDLNMEVAFEKSIPAMHTLNATKILFSH